MIKRMLSLTLAALMLLAVMISAAAGEELPEAKEYYVYTENGKDLNVRDEPGGNIVGTLPYGTKVTVSGVINEEWAMITFTYNKEGLGSGEWPAYVSRRFLIDVPPEALKEIIAKEKEAYTGDPMTDINAEFLSARDVENYKISIRPARVTSWVNMRWIPSETGMIICAYKAGEELTVLKETDHYVQVQDTDTGDVGYIHKKFMLRVQ